MHHQAMLAEIPSFRVSGSVSSLVRRRDDLHTETSPRSGVAYGGPESPGKPVRRSVLQSRAGSRGRIRAVAASANGDVLIRDDASGRLLHRWTLPDKPFGHIKEAVTCEADSHATAVV
ncbi:MAG: hypothetical protein ACF8TS_10920 [Maioricimonas sp. JB049]